MKILGVGLTGKLIFVNTTLGYRKEGLPLHLHVLSKLMRVYCLNCNNGKVVSWCFGGNIVEHYDSFDDYLQNQFYNAIENN